MATFSLKTFKMVIIFNSKLHWVSEKIIEIKVNNNLVIIPNIKLFQIILVYQN